MNARALVDIAVFGGFGVLAAYHRTGGQRIILVLLAAAGYRFARGPVSKVIAIAAFLVGWFTLPAAGAVLLTLLWLTRSSIDEGRRLKTVEAEPPNSPVAPTRVPEEPEPRSQALPPPPQEEAPQPSPAERALEDLLAAPQPGARATIESGLGSKSPELRVRCLAALAGLGAEQSIPRMAPLLQAREPAVREAAATALGLLGAAAEAPALLAALDEPSWEVRAAAARALGLLRYAPALPRLAARSADAHDEVSRAAVEALGRLRSPATVGTLVERLREDLVRVEAAEALVAMSTCQAADDLRPLLSSTDIPLLLAVLDVVGARGDHVLSPEVRLLADDADVDVREAARRALDLFEHREAG